MGGRGENDESEGREHLHIYMRRGLTRDSDGNNTRRGAGDEGW